jgi:hypothetical protein
MLRRFNEFAQVATCGNGYKEREGGCKTTLSFRGRRSVRVLLSPVPERLSAVVLFAELVRAGPSPVFDDAGPRTGRLASGRHRSC